MRRARKVEILGCGLTIGRVPNFDPQAERWGMNNLIGLRYAHQFDNWHRWFDLHGLSVSSAQYPPETIRWMQQQTKPIYRWQCEPTMPSSRQYPREAVQAYFHGDREFAASLSWMMALAIYEGFSEIDVFWCPLTEAEEHEAQIASAKYWIGQARGRGIAVTVHGDSALHPSPVLYGCES